MKWMGRSPLALLVLVAGFAEAPAAIASPQQAACIAVAAAPEEPLAASGEGFPIDQVDSGQAVPLCQQAFREDPRSPVYSYRYGRALLATGSLQDLGRGMTFMSAAWGLAKMATTQDPDRASVHQWYWDEAQAAMTPDTYLASAEAGDPWAQTVLAYIYGMNRGVVEKDPATRRAWLEKALAQGYPYALFMAGADAVASGDTVEGRRLLEQAAGSGLAAAAYHLWSLHNSEGPVPDGDAARSWLASAAALGHQEAIRIVDADSLSPLERSLMGEDGIEVPARYDEPTEHEILLAYVRAHCASGRCLKHNAFQYGFFADEPVYDITVLGIEKKQCERHENGFYICSFQPRISVSLIDRDYGIDGPVADGAVDFMNRRQMILTMTNFYQAMSGLYQHRHIFQLTQAGWRSPDLALFSMNGNPVQGLLAVLDLQALQK